MINTSSSPIMTAAELMTKFVTSLHFHGNQGLKFQVKHLLADDSNEMSSLIKLFYKDAILENDICKSLEAL